MLSLQILHIVQLPSLQAATTVCVKQGVSKNYRVQLTCSKLPSAFDLHPQQKEQTKQWKLATDKNAHLSLFSLQQAQPIVRFPCGWISHLHELLPTPTTLYCKVSEATSFQCQFSVAIRFQYFSHSPSFPIHILCWNQDTTAPTILEDPRPQSQQQKVLATNIFPMFQMQTQPLVAVKPLVYSANKLDFGTMKTNVTFLCPDHYRRMDLSSHLRFFVPRYSESVPLEQLVSKDWWDTLWSIVQEWFGVSKLDCTIVVAQAAPKSWTRIAPTVFVISADCFPVHPGVFDQTPLKGIWLVVRSIVTLCLEQLKPPSSPPADQQTYALLFGNTSKVQPRVYENFETQVYRVVVCKFLALLCLLKMYSDHAFTFHQYFLRKLWHIQRKEREVLKQVYTNAPSMRICGPFEKWPRWTTANFAFDATLSFAEERHLYLLFKSTAPKIRLLLFFSALSQYIGKDGWGKLFGVQNFPFTFSQFLTNLIAMFNQQGLIKEDAHSLVRRFLAFDTVPEHYFLELETSIQYPLFQIKTNISHPIKSHELSSHQFHIPCCFLMWGQHGPATTTTTTTSDDMKDDTFEQDLDLLLKEFDTQEKQVRRRNNDIPSTVNSNTDIRVDQFQKNILLKSHVTSKFQLERHPELPMFETPRRLYGVTQEHFTLCLFEKIEKVRLTRHLLCLQLGYGVDAHSFDVSTTLFPPQTMIKHPSSWHFKQMLRGLRQEEKTEEVEVSSDTTFLIDRWTQYLPFLAIPLSMTQSMEITAQLLHSLFLNFLILFGGSKQAKQFLYAPNSKINQIMGVQRVEENTETTTTATTTTTTTREAFSIHALVEALIRLISTDRIQHWSATAAAVEGLMHLTSFPLTKAWAERTLLFDKLNIILTHACFDPNTRVFRWKPTTFEDAVRTMTFARAFALQCEYVQSNDRGTSHDDSSVCVRVGGSVFRKYTHPLAVNSFLQFFRDHPFFGPVYFECLELMDKQQVLEEKKVYSVQKMENFLARNKKWLTEIAAKSALYFAQQATPFEVYMVSQYMMSLGRLRLKHDDERSQGWILQMDIMVMLFLALGTTVLPALPATSNKVTTSLFVLGLPSVITEHVLIALGHLWRHKIWPSWALRLPRKQLLTTFLHSPRIFSERVRLEAFRALLTTYDCSPGFDVDNVIRIFENQILSDYLAIGRHTVQDRMRKELQVFATAWKKHKSLF